MFCGLDDGSVSSPLPMSGRANLLSVLSGTPLQNDLGEYWSMTEFVCPDLLGSRASFTREFEKPITKSRTVGCSEQALEDGKKQAAKVHFLRPRES